MSKAQPFPPKPVDLHAVAGLPVAAENASLTLRFGERVVAPEPERRTAAELRGVLLDPAAADAEAAPLYAVYRGIAPEEAVDEIAMHRMVYVALVLRAGRLGEEWVRTRGHVNSPAPGTSLPFPEIHEVWQGRALLYLQTQAAAEVDDIVAVELLPGDKAIVPPGWASLLTNVGDVPLVCGSWRAAGSEPHYENLEALRGMAHYVLAGPEAGRWSFEPNTRYRSVPVPRRVRCPDLGEFGLKRDIPMLTTFRSNPEFFHFMRRPQDSDYLWNDLYAE